MRLSPGASWTILALVSAMSFIGGCIQGIRNTEYKPEYVKLECIAVVTKVGEELERSFLCKPIKHKDLRVVSP